MYSKNQHNMAKQLYSNKKDVHIIKMKILEIENIISKVKNQMNGLKGAFSFKIKESLCIISYYKAC